MSDRLEKGRRQKRHEVTLSDHLLLALRWSRNRRSCRTLTQYWLRRLINPKKLAASRGDGAPQRGSPGAIPAAMPARERAGGCGFLHSYDLADQLDRQELMEIHSRGDPICACPF
jgi:hypothetical protein